MTIPNKLGQRTILEDVAVIRTLLMMDHAKAYSDDGQSIANGAWQTVVFENEVYDTGSEYDHTTGVFTAGRGGLLHVSAATIYAPSTAWGATEAAILGVEVNGSRVAHIDRQTDFSSANIRVQCSGSVTIEVEDGETVSIKVYQNSGGALALLTNRQYNYVCFDWLL